ncbi:MAG: tyrosine-type recombinase/integrase [Nocardioidaceae bacterium]
MRAIERYATGSGKRRYKVRFRRGGRQTSKTFATARDARAFAAILDTDGVQAALDYFTDRTRDAATPTLDEFVPEHISALSGVQAGTRVDYQRVYDRTWSPRLGARQLHDITKTDISRAVTDLSEHGGLRGTGLSDKSVVNAYGMLASVFSDATERGLVTKTPCRGIRMPQRTSHESEEMRFLTRAEYLRLRDATMEHYQPLVEFLFGTGCRWGEAVALLTSDVDLETGVIRIRRALKWSGTGAGERVIGPPKTKRGRRTVALPPGLDATLAPLVEGHTGEVFRAVKGGPVMHAYFWREVWRPALDRAGIAEPWPRIHDARHTHASWLVSGGRNLVAIQRRLGHQNISTTIDRYSHLSPDEDVSAARLVAGIMSREEPPAIEAE